MAIFKIIASRPQKIKDFDHHPEMDIDLISGELNVGDKFTIYETHHPFDVIIKKIERCELITLSISCPVSYQGWHVGTIVDTENPEDGRKYGYRTKDAKQLYHSDILKEDVIDNINKFSWWKFTHAYGFATDVPKHIVDLLYGDEDEFDNALDDGLHSIITHQYSLYSVTPYVISFLLDALITESYRKDYIQRRLKILEFIKGCADNKNKSSLGEVLPFLEFFLWIIRIGIKRLSIDASIKKGKEYYKKISLEGNPEEREIAKYLLEFCNIKLVSELFQRIEST